MTSIETTFAAAEAKATQAVTDHRVSIGERRAAADVEWTAAISDHRNQARVDAAWKVAAKLNEEVESVGRQALAVCLFEKVTAFQALRAEMGDVEIFRHVESIRLAGGNWQQFIPYLPPSYLVDWHGPGACPVGCMGEKGGWLLPRGMFPVLEKAIADTRSKWPVRVYPADFGPVYGGPDTAGNKRVFGPDGLAFGRLVNNWWYTGTVAIVGAAVRYKLPA